MGKLTGIIEQDLPLPSNKKPQQGGTRLAVAGKIKVGYKTKDGLPKSLDFFRCDAEPVYQEMFYQALGKKPTRIPVIFLSDDPAHSCNVRYELRDNTGALFVKSDGRHFEISQGTHWATFTREQVVAKYQTIEGFMDQALEHSKSTTGWAVRLNLRFLIPAIQNFVAEWTFSTGGVKSSIEQVTGAWFHVLETAGTVQMIPFDLVVKMAKSDRSGSKSRFPVVNLIPNFSLENMQVVRNFIEAGMQVWQAGVLTADKIQALKEGNVPGLDQPKQLADGKETTGTGSD